MQITVCESFALLRQFVCLNEGEKHTYLHEGGVDCHPDLVQLQIRLSRGA